jgi:hypothetical protein
VERYNVVPHLWQAGREANADRVRAYRSQLDESFPSGHVPTRPEVYWLPLAATDRSPNRTAPTMAAARTGQGDGGT